MKVYNPNVSCPKCGHTTVNTWYLSTYLTRTCQRCRHSWEELPLDYGLFNNATLREKMEDFLPIPKPLTYDEESIEANSEIPISTTPLPKFVYTPKAMDYDQVVENATEPESTAPPAAKCWCGLELKALGMPDFMEDDPNDTTSICTTHSECEVHGRDYQRKPYAGIAISGKARAGKSTLADMLVQKLGASWHVESLSDAVLEEFAKENWMIEYSERGLEILLDRINKDKETYRPFLIELGQRRRAEDPDYWIKRLPGHPNAIIANCRFVNEYNYFKKNDFYMVRVDATSEVREARGCPDLADISETDLDSVKLWNWDYVTYNNNTLNHLDYQADNITQIVLHGMKPDCQCGCDCETKQGEDSGSN